jgi:hypothetical protein
LQCVSGFLTCTSALISAMNNSTDSQYWTLPDPVTFPSVEGNLADWQGLQASLKLHFQRAQLQVTSLHTVVYWPCDGALYNVLLRGQYMFSQIPSCRRWQLMGDCPN